MLFEFGTLEEGTVHRITEPLHAEQQQTMKTNLFNKLYEKQASQEKLHFDCIVWLWCVLFNGEYGFGDVFVRELAVCVCR